MKYAMSGGEPRCPLSLGQLDWQFAILSIKIRLSGPCRKQSAYPATHLLHTSAGAGEAQHVET